MTNKEKLTEVFGIEEADIRCSCTRENVPEKCITSGRCLHCKKWLESEYKESEDE